MSRTGLEPASAEVTANSDRSRLIFFMGISGSG
jgi:hypothetical protein